MKKATLAVALLILAFGLLEASLQLAGFVYRHLSKHATEGKNTYTVLCIGDASTAEEYPRYLEKALETRAAGVPYDIIVDGGRGAATTSFILAELEDNIRLVKPDMIVAMMGMNDELETLVYETVREQKLPHALKTYTMFTVTARQLRAAIKRVNNTQKEVRALPALAFRQFYRNEEEEKTLKKQGYFYFDNKEYEKAQGYFRQIVSINPESYDGYIGLAKCGVQMRKNMKEVEQHCKKALAINPASEEGCIELALCYREMGEKAKEEVMFLKALEVNPESEKANLYLSFFYFREKRFTEYEKVYARITNRKRSAHGAKKGGVAAKLSSAASLVLGMPSGNRRMVGTDVASVADAAGFGWYNKASVYNFRKLAKACKENGIRLVCMQYPRASIAPLKKIFGPDDGVLFVDNEAVFNEAVHKDGYGAYFKDTRGNAIGYAFGMCTPKANTIIAENLARVIADESRRGKVFE